jgi:hypothetical protein
MSLSAQDTSISAESFTYTPLDLTQRSIRLLCIDPDLSSSGYVQCDMRDATVYDGYTCLSYVWGPPDDGYPVVINERLYRVRENLFDFLQHARKKNFGWLWIDALCIDQANTGERTHQVQQMGQIYSRASRVVSWLGASPDIAKLLRQIPYTDEGGGYGDGVASLLTHRYWTRAWVTQEVILARQLSLMAGEVELSKEHLPQNLGYSVVNSGHLVQWLQFSEGPKRSKNMSLIHLLDTFHAQECETPHDRVFSLLALCRESSDLRVDYEASLEEIVWRICKCCAFCLCSLGIISRALLRDNNRPQSIDRPISNFKLLRTLYAEVRTEHVDQKENCVFFANPGPHDLSTFIRMNAWFLNNSKKKAHYTTSYFIPMSWICGKPTWERNWYLALCVSSERAGFDYYHLPDDSSSSRSLHEASRFGIQHWADDLQVVYDKPRLGTVRLSLAFWAQLSLSRAWLGHSRMGFCVRATEEWGGLKLSDM